MKTIYPDFMFNWEMYKDSYIKKNVEKFGSGMGDQFFNHLYSSVSKVRLFEIEDKVKSLLALTKTPTKNVDIHLPFDPMFLDISFTKEELQAYGYDVRCDWVQGIILSIGNFIRSDTQEVAGTGLRLSFQSLRDGMLYHDTINRNPNLKDEYKYFNISIKGHEGTDKALNNFIHLFSLNVLNFINDPLVDLIYIKRGRVNSEKRARKKKIPMPSGYRVRLNGEIRKYVNSITKREHSGFSHRFWVRGHFRTLRSPRYKENQGKRIWIPPYQKGEGILVEKPYRLK